MTTDEMLHSPCETCTRKTCLSVNCYTFEKWFIPAWNEARLLLMRNAALSPNSIPTTTFTTRQGEHMKRLAEINRKGVVQCNPGTGDIIATYPSARVAQSVTGVQYQNISACCRGKARTAGGYIWKFADQLED